MALSSPQRSRSAPQPLTALAASSSISAFDVTTTTKASAVPHLGALSESPPASPHAEIPDAFNLDGGFFPRSNSYFALNEANKKPERQRTWVYGHDDHFSPASQSLSLRADDAGSRSGVSSPLTSGFSQPTTPGPSLGILSPDHDHDILKELEGQDVVGGLAYTAFAAAAKVGTPAFDGPSYDHDNLFHSYETLHSTFSAKRRSATVPNFASYAPKLASRGGMYAELEAPKKDAKVSVLFSPDEEKVDLFDLMNDPNLKDGDERSIQEGDSWTSYIYESAKRLWVRKSQTI